MPSGRQYDTNQLYFAETVTQTALASAGSKTFDFDVTAYERLLLVGMIIAAGAAGDVAISVKPFAPDGTTLINQELPVNEVVAAALVGADAIQQRSYNLRGVSKVRCTVQNNNAGAKDARMHIFAS